MTDLHVLVVSQWQMSQRMNMDKNRIISSSAFDGYRQSCKCRTWAANKWHTALYFQLDVRANKPRGGKQAVDPSTVTFCNNSWESFANTLNPVLILHGRRVCQKRSCNTKGAVTWIWMTPSMWRKELSVQWDTCCKTKAPLAIMLFVSLYKVLKSHWLGFLLSPNGIHTPFLSSNPRVLGFIVSGEHTETVSKQRYCQNPFRRYSRTSADLCQTHTHSHSRNQESLGFSGADARHLWHSIQ